MGFLRYILLITVFVLHGCATPIEVQSQREERAQRLAAEILTLSPEITLEEARRFASAAVEISAQLGQKYNVKLHPWLHNASIHAGLRDRGFCYQYAEDLYQGLQEVSTEHLTLIYIEANKGKLNEHHALSLVLKGKAWDTGILLDAWRQNGNLYFAAVKTDSYPWKPEPLASL